VIHASGFNHIISLLISVPNQDHFRLMPFSYVFFDLGPDLFQHSVNCTPEPKAQERVADSLFPSSPRGG